MNAATARPGGAPFVYGWYDAGAAAPATSTSLLTAVVLAAAPAGWLIGAAAVAVTRRARRAPALAGVH